MPKTYSGLWEGITSFKNLYLAYVDAKRSKRWTNEVLRFGANLEENLIDIQNRLIWREWEPGPWRVFEIYEPKKRVIHAPPFCDRVVHHALVRITGPLFERKFIYDSYACRVDKGTHAAADRAQEFARKMRQEYGRFWVLKADIKSYFPSVHHETLKRIYRRTIRDRGTLWLLDTILGGSGFPGRGIPIGALTSQMMANVYLDQLDHRMKDDLGLKCYLRYMDDFLVFHPDKRFLRDLLEDTRDYLRNELLLDLNPKTQIFSWVQGVDFCGYRTWPDKRLPRKRNVRRARRRFTKLRELYSQGKIELENVRGSVASFLGYMRHCRGRLSTERILEDFVLRREKE